MRIVVLAALMLISMTAHSAPVTNLSFGGGFNLSKPTVDDDLGEGVDEAYNLDLGVGLKANTAINETVGFRSGLYLHQKTAGFDIDIDGDKGDINGKVIYLSVPLTVQLEANENFAFYGGYILDYAINSYCNAGGDFESCTLNEDAKQITHVATVGTVLHASEKWDLELGYQHGLSEVFDDLKIHAFQLMAYYKF